MLPQAGARANAAAHHSERNEMLRLPTGWGMPDSDADLWITPMPGHDLNRPETEREDRLAKVADELLERNVATDYAKAVAQRGVGPFYRRTQPSTAYTPPRSE